MTVDPVWQELHGRDFLCEQTRRVQALQDESDGMQESAKVKEVRQRRAWWLFLNTVASRRPMVIRPHLTFNFLAGRAGRSFGEALDTSFFPSPRSPAAWFPVPERAGGRTGIGWKGPQSGDERAGALGFDALRLHVSLCRKRPHARSCLRPASRLSSTARGHVITPAITIAYAPR